MGDTREVLRNFYAAVVKRESHGGSRASRNDMLFEGLFETYRSTDE